MTTPVRYNFELLMECMKRDNAVLDLTVYTKESLLNSKLKIEGQCSCGNKFSKSFTSCYKEGGLFCNNCVSLNRLEKVKQTNLKNLGVENPMQSSEVREKYKQTNLKNLGVEHPMQSSKVREKVIQTNLKNLGVEHPMQSSKVKEKVIQTNLKIRGVENPGQDPDVQEKMKQTNLKIRGVENSFQCDKVKEKIRQTCKDTYGFEHVMQNYAIAEKCSKNSYSLKQYSMPSGKICNLQGYEPFALDIILKTYKEDDIVLDKKDVPELWYGFENSIHRHYVDIYIPSIKKCIEVKSTWTYDKNEEKVLAKQKAAKDLGYQYEIWIFDNKKQLINTIM